MATLTAAPASATPPPVDLSGPWTVRLDPRGDGLPAPWSDAPFDTPCALPGSLDAQGIGDPTTEPQMGRLTRLTSFVGAAFYRRTVRISEDWAGRDVELFLERAHWETSVWVDGQFAGTQDSLCVPHRHDLTRLLTPGAEHVLTLRVDNRLKINLGHFHGDMQWAHSVTDQTQTNWNGVIGRMELRSHSPSRITNARFFPDFARKELLVRLDTAHRGEAPLQARARVVLESGNHREEHDAGVVSFAPGLLPAAREAAITLPLSDALPRWDEFDPRTIKATISFDEASGIDPLEATFGVRDFRVAGRHFTLNGRVVHLRGNVDNAAFPQTGFPPMDVAAWREYLQIMKDHGFNHVRFHSWCPPAAAFVAADELGFMLQVENPIWDGYGLVGRNVETSAFITRESQRIIDAHGNHPSFCLMSMGNELGDGGDALLAFLVDRLRQRDPRILYTTTTHPANMKRADDYFSSAVVEEGWIRGLDIPRAHKSGNAFDYDAALSRADRPVLAHEVGQAASLPKFDVAEKLHGPLRALYLDEFKRRYLERNPIEDEPRRRRASEDLQALLYKDEIEAQLRSSESPGFQLLNVQDYCGQGVALIGVLDMLFQPKGSITADEWRRFCAPTVLLMRMERRDWRVGETFVADIEARHHGAADIANAKVEWTATLADGTVLASGTLPIAKIETGGLRPLGRIEQSLAAFPASAEVTWTLRLAGTEIQNEWRTWTWPAAQEEPAIPAGVHVRDTWDEEAQALLARGETVVLSLGKARLRRATPTRFFPIFWCKQLFPGQHAGMGLVIDPSHPLLAAFPTRGHSDWQWSSLMDGAQALSLAGLGSVPANIIVHNDDFNTALPMTVLCEARVGPGRLIATTLNLGNAGERTAPQRAFLSALLAHAAAPASEGLPALSAAQAAALLEAKPRHAAASEKPDLASALLHVRCGAQAPAFTNTAWSGAMDATPAAAAGFSASTTGQCWVDTGGHAWFGGRFDVVVSVPRGFEGRLALWMHDWNGQARAAHLFVVGVDRGPLSDYGDEGAWLLFPLSAADTADGEVRVNISTISGPNAMLREIAVLPPG